MKLTISQLKKLIRENLLIENQIEVKIIKAKDSKNIMNDAKDESSKSNKKIAIYNSDKSMLTIFSNGKIDKDNPPKATERLSKEKLLDLLNKSKSEFALVYFVT